MMSRAEDRRRGVCLDLGPGNEHDSRAVADLTARRSRRSMVLAGPAWHAVRSSWRKTDDVRGLPLPARRDPPQTGDAFPLVRVDCSGVVYQGRLTRSDSDPEHRKSSSSPYGILVLENVGLSRTPEMILQIANITEGGIDAMETA